MMNRERMTGRSRFTGDGPTSLGMNERLERVLAYPLGWVTGLILFVLERKNRNVQWHAKQSMAEDEAAALALVQKAHVQ